MATEESRYFSADYVPIEVVQLVADCIQTDTVLDMGPSQYWVGTTMKYNCAMMQNEYCSVRLVRKN